MANLSFDTEVKVATNAAQDFIENYYPTLNKPQSRANIKSFYIRPTATSPLKPSISLNGAIIEDPAALQEIFEKKVFKAEYEVQDYDCQVLNTNYNVGAAENALGADKDGKKMSILVVVNGTVKYWNTEEGEDARGYMETFVLVPNWQAQGPRAAKGEKKWLIQSQTFRLIF